MPKYSDIEIFAKSTKKYKVTFYKNNLVENIADWTVYFVVKENKEDADIDAKITKTITSHLNASIGETLIELSTSDTNLDGVHYYEVSYLDGEANQEVVYYGKINFRKPTLQSRA